MHNFELFQGIKKRDTIFKKKAKQVHIFIKPMKDNK